MTSLLAKSPRGGRTLTLLQHLLDTEQAASALFRTGTRWATSYLRFFKVPVAEHTRFLLNLRLSALFHDLGKANAGFQQAIVAGRFVTQPLRHEHLSAIILAHPVVDAWLGANQLVDRDVVLAAVLSHHIKASESGEWQVLQSKSAAPTSLFFADPQVVATLERIRIVADLAPLALRLPARYDDDAWTEAWEALWARAARFRADLRRDPPRLALNLAVKAALIAADSVSSGLVREGYSIEEWIEEAAHAPALDSDSVVRDILAPRTAQLSRTRPFAYQRFQDGAATIGRRGFLLASCGAGKTLAAWRWADAVARSEPIGRVIFLYPTRGTATEGFRDYVGHAPERTAALVHGTSRYELLGMQSNVPELPASLHGKEFVPDEAEMRLFSLGLWSKRYFSATVDQFLGFMEHSYRSLCLLPAMADAAVIFDEVHSYDPRMWQALVSFLERFDVPALCMTATLSPTRKFELARHLRIYPDDSERTELADLEQAENHPRYRLEVVAGEDAAVEAVIASASDGQRVLWVVNTVRRCQRLASRLQRSLQRDVVVYHSRFKLEDRQRRHRETVDSFRGPEDGDPGSVIAVTTQVCEMSLDLDADVLVTEHAPISSLVQRFGRANRHLRRGGAFRATLLTYEPESVLPYEADDLAAARAFLGALNQRDLSQRDLAMGLEVHSPAGRFAADASRFANGGFFATPGNLRDTDDSGSPVVLDCDVEVFRGLLATGQPTDGLRLTVPRKVALSTAPDGLPSWLRVADGSRYSAWLGFLSDDDLITSQQGPR